MNREELPVYSGDKEECEVCKKAFSQGEVITVGEDGAVVCYTDGDGGCGLKYIFTTGKMFVGNPMVFKPKESFVENEAGELAPAHPFSLGILFCLMGLHRLEEEPSHKELVKETGVHFAFWSEGVQKGVKKCLRPGCDKKVKVWRSGWVGSGGTGTRWKRLSKRQEKYIDSLPTM